MQKFAWVLATVPLHHCPDPEPPPSATIDEFAPRSAGRINRMWVSGVTPGATVAVQTAGAAGQVELAGCPGSLVDPGTSAVAGDEGTALLDVPVDVALQGL